MIILMFVQYRIVLYVLSNPEYHILPYNMGFILILFAYGEYYILKIYFRT